MRLYDYRQKIAAKRLLPQRELERYEPEGVPPFISKVTFSTSP